MVRQIKRDTGGQGGSHGYVRNGACEELWVGSGRRLDWAGGGGGWAKVIYFTLSSKIEESLIVGIKPFTMCSASASKV